MLSEYMQAWPKRELTNLRYLKTAGIDDVYIYTPKHYIVGKIRYRFGKNSIFISGRYESKGKHAIYLLKNYGKTWIACERELDDREEKLLPWNWGKLMEDIRDFQEDIMNVNDWYGYGQKGE